MKKCSSLIILIISLLLVTVGCDKQLSFEGKEPIDKMISVEPVTGIESTQGKGSPDAPLTVTLYEQSEGVLKISRHIRVPLDAIMACSPLTSWISFDQKTQELTIIPPATLTTSSHTIICQIDTDIPSNSGNQLFMTINVLEINQPPQLTILLHDGFSNFTGNGSKEDPYLIEAISSKEAFIFFEAKDQNPQSLVVSCNNLPDWMSFDPKLLKLSVLPLAMHNSSLVPFECEVFDGELTGLQPLHFSLTVLDPQQINDGNGQNDIDATMAIIGGNEQSSFPNKPFPHELKVQLIGPNGALPEAQIHFQVESGAAQLNQWESKTDATGIASTTLTAGAKSGVVKVRATWKDQFALFNLLITTEKNLSIGGGNGQKGFINKTMPDPLKVLLADADGAVANEPIIFSLDAGGGILQKTIVETDETGMAASGFTAGATPGKVIVRASWKEKSVTFNLDIVTEKILSITSGDGQDTNAGQPFATPLKALLFDTEGGVQGEMITFSIDKGDAILATPLVTTDINGIAETIVTAGKNIGDIEIRATWNEQFVIYSLSIETEKNLSILGGTGQSAFVNEAFSSPLVTQLTDRSGGVPGQTINFSVESGSGSISTPQVVTNEQGIAEINLTATEFAGQVKVKASWMDKSTTFTLTVSPEPEKKLISIRGNGQSVFTGTTVTNPLQVQLTGIDGGVADETIVFSIEEGLGSIQTVTTETDPAGMASTLFTAGDQIGETKIKATWKDKSITFTIETIERPTYGISLLSGDNQTGIVGSTLTRKLAVSVTDSETGAPKESADIRFRVLLGGGLVNENASIDVVSDSQGKAEVIFQLGVLAGSNKVEASIIGNQNQKVLFNLEGTPGLPSASQSTVTTDPQTLPADGVSSSVLTMILKDQYGNPTTHSDTTVAFAIDAGSLLGVLIDNNNGTYSQTMRIGTTIPNSGYVSVGGTINNDPISSDGKAQINLLPGIVSLSDSTITTDRSHLNAGTGETTTVTLTLRDKFGNKVFLGGQNISLTSTAGSFIGDPTDNNDGTYSQLLKSGTVAGSIVINGTVGGTPIGGTASITIKPDVPDLTKSSITVAPNRIEPDGFSKATITVILRDQYSNPISGVNTLAINTTDGSFTESTIDNGNGSYTRVIAATNISSVATITATVDAIPLTDSATLYMSSNISAPSANHSKVEIVGDTPLAANGSSQTLVKVTLFDSSNSPFTSGGSNVVISSTAGTLIGSTIDIGDGTYTQTIQSPTQPAADVVISATVDGLTLVETAMIDFYGPLHPETSSLNALPRAIEANGSATTLIELQAKDINGTNIPVGGYPIGNSGLVLATTSGTLLANLVDNGNGTYSQYLQSQNSESTATVSVSDNGTATGQTVEVTFYEAFNLAGYTIDCSNVADLNGVVAGKIIKGGPIVVDGGTLTINTRGPNGYCPENMVFTQVIVKNSGTITHSPAYEMTTDTYGLEMTADHVMIDATSSINLNHKGHRPTDNWSYMIPNGVGGGAHYRSSFAQNGAAHGGMGSGSGSATQRMRPYGSLFEPTLLGAGTRQNSNADAGGGRLKLTVLGSLKIDGTISANGESTSHHSHGAGAGGSIWIDTHTIEGIGTIQAIGGAGLKAGGGGRIAIYYQNTGENFSYPSSMINNINAYGGTIGDAAAGTIFLKNKVTQTYGDLIINNHALASSEIKTVLLGPATADAQSVSPTILTKTNFFSDLSNTFIYQNYYLIPDILENSTTNLLDNSRLKIINGDAHSITIDGNITAIHKNVGTDQFGLALLFDNLEISGHARVSSNLAVISLKGDLSSSDDVTAFVDGQPPDTIEYALDNVVTIDLTGMDPIKPTTQIWYDLTLKGSNVHTQDTTLFAHNVTLDGYEIVSNMDRTQLLFDISNTLTLMNSSKITQAATSSIANTVEKSIEMNAGHLSVDASSQISSAGKGYKTNTSRTCHTVNNTEITVTERAYTHTYIKAAASHGGLGALGDDTIGNSTYGNLFDPYWSGASCKNDQTNQAGGGIIRIDLGNGSASINGILTVDAASNASSDSRKIGSAGGSIKLSAGSISGTGSIQANGGSGYAGGGGGRIAIYYATLAGSFSMPNNYLSGFQAYGGNGYQTTRHGGAGTIYLKDKAADLGDLILNNNGQTLTTSYTDAAGRGTLIKLPGGLPSTDLAKNALFFSGNLSDSGQYLTQHLNGFYLSPKRKQNGTHQFSDDTLIPITSHTKASIKTSTGDLTTLATVGDLFDVIAKFRKVHIGGGSVLRIEGGGGIIVTEGDMTNASGQFNVANGNGAEGNGWIDFSLMTDVTLDFITLKSYYDEGVNTLTIGSSSDLEIISGPTSATLQNVTGIWSSPTFQGNLTLLNASLQVTNSLTVSGDLIIDSGTSITAENIAVGGHLSIDGNSIIQHPDIGEGTIIYGLTISANDFTLENGSSIDLKGRGPSNSITHANFRVPGPTGMQNISNSNFRGGGSHGGQGGIHSTSYIPLNTYGSLFEPIEPGAAGYRQDNNYQGTDGGGRVKIIVTGTATINGDISVNGSSTSTNRRYCGAAGSIWLDGDTITGNGNLTAIGGNCTSTTETTGGGGGRIAVYYNTTSGGFGYPTNIGARLDASGGLGRGSSGNSSYNGAAGTIYLKDKDDQTYGDLIIDAKEKSSSNVKTHLPGVSPATADSVSEFVISKTSFFAPNYTDRFAYTGYYLIPLVGENNTDHVSDDSRFFISSGTKDFITTNTSGIQNLHTHIGIDQFQLGLFFDNIDITGEANVDSSGMPIVSVGGGDFSSFDDLTAVLTGNIPRSIEFSGNINVTFDVTSSGSLPGLVADGWHHLTILGNGQELSINKAISANTLTLDHFTIKSNIDRQSPLLSLTGTLALRNNAHITQTPTSSTPGITEKSIEIIATGLSISSDSSIDASEAGYVETTQEYCRTIGNQRIRRERGTTNSMYAGASHGGYGGIWSSTFGQNNTYGNLTDPYWSGASCRYDSTRRGGGIVRIDLGNGNAIIDGSIKANGENATVNNSNKRTGPAGGSIKLVAGSISGIGHLSAIGGNGSSAGGGGRIAVYYTSLGGNFATPTNQLLNIRAWGGQTSYQGTRNGHAGTIYLKDKAETDGDLIINNNGATLCTNGSSYGIGTPIKLPGEFIVQSSLTSTSLTASLNMIESGIMSQHLSGFYLNPNINQNASKKFTDDQLFPISSHNATTFTTSADLTTIASTGHTASVVARLRKLHIVGNGLLRLEGTGTVIVSEGDANSANGTFSMTSGNGIEGDGLTTLDLSQLTTVNLQNAGQFSTIFHENAAVSITNGTGLDISGQTITPDLTLDGAIVSMNNVTLSGITTITNGAQISIAGSSSFGGAVTINNGSSLTSAVPLSFPSHLTISDAGTNVSLTTATIGGNLTIDNATLTAGSPDKVTKSLDILGDISLTSGGSIFSQNTSSTIGGTEYFLHIKAGDILIDGTSSINASEKGYKSSGNSNDHVRSIGNLQYSSGRASSHGGHGGYSTTYGPTYGNFTKPRELGSSVRTGNRYCGSGGGSIYIESNDIQIDGNIVANGGDDPDCGGAGGSILVETISIRGIGSLSATGGADTGSRNYYGGGGGRIALYFVNSFDSFSYPSSMTDQISAAGGTTDGDSARNGAAGTVYLFQTGSSTYGDLYVDNANRASTVFTDLSWYTSGFSSSLNPTVLGITTSNFGYEVSSSHNYPIDNRYMGFCVNPNTAENVTDTLTDDALFKVTSSLDNQLIVSGNMTTVAAISDPFRLVLCLDNLTVSRKGHLKVGGADIYVTGGDIKTTDFTLDGGLTANVIDVNTANWINGANASTNANKKCDLSGCVTP